jgi:predicted DCC family thiol-disulfide oxidoreductase YuxK
VLIIYDGDCHFCRWGIHLVERLDRRDVFGFCPFGHPVAESHLSELPPDRRYSSFHLVDDGELFSATEAAKRALAQLPLGRLAVRLGAHRLYPLVAANRAFLGRFVPSRSVLNTCRDVRADTARV